MAVGALDSDAFARLYDEAANDIFRFCLRRCGDRDRAEDLLSVVFLEAWRCRDKAVAVEGSMRPWLFGIAANVIRSEARAKRRHRAAIERYRVANPESALADPAGDVVAAAVQPELARTLDAAIASLPQRERVLADLCLVEQIPVSAAALALNIPLGTAKSRLSRARRRLQRLLRTSELVGRGEPAGNVQGARADRVPSGRRS